MKRTFTLLSVMICLVVSIKYSFAQHITSPKTHFGFEIGEDYQLSNFSQTEAYFKKLDQESPRVQYVQIGKTEEGRDQPMLIISSEENLKKLDHYKQISRSLARAKMSNEEAKMLANEGKSVVWIDGGLHANEVVATNQLIQTAYSLATMNDPETLNILENCIILMVHANPDGHEMMGNWYMREENPTKRSTNFLPYLYQKYAGHDNNRDFFMLNLKESQNLAKQLFIEWVPQIMYNHHQTAPAGAVVAGAPYRDPFNYVFDPLLMSGIDALGAAMSSRLNAENKPGYTAKNGSVFSTWYNGGLRTTTYFHNMIGLLTEIIGNPTPFEIPVVPSRLIPSSNTQNPVLPQKWHFKQSIDYSVSLNYAVMSYASKYKNEVLYNIYRMGKNSIERGSTDFWSLSPSKVALIDSALKKAIKANPKLAANRTEERKVLQELYGNPAMKDPRGYIISADQPDFTKAIKFLNALIQNGIEVSKATNAFTANGKNYPAGSYIVKTNQAFRPHILDMFEPQDHPDDFEYPGGPPIPPYDAAGWTLAYIMDVKFDRLLTDFEGPFELLPYGQQISPTSFAIPKTKYSILSTAINETFARVNQLLEQKIPVWRDQQTGNFYVESKSLKHSTIPVQAENKLPKTAQKITKLRIGLWDTYGGSMPSGWLRLILEQHQYDFKVVYPTDIDQGDLHKQFDVLIFPGNSIPRLAGTTSNSNAYRPSLEMPDNIPSPYKERIGRLTLEKSIPILKTFLEQGGKIVTIGNSSDLAQHLGLAVQSALVSADQQALKRTEFYTPGSVLMAKVSQESASTKGYEGDIDVYYNNDNVFKLNHPDIKPLIWFDKGAILKSGWSWGEKYLQETVLAFEANVGKGKLVTFANDITFRAQTQGTFKLLFNQLQ
ncbi:M14 family metallopeptidase [Sphingobacterium sp. HJSM2_6]|uniref:M14 family metallopeptidase n=1 Tax=Sphingobacterium sp. HJSM2_6 TaxID=3366264 RepID=UPI003BC81D42